MSVPRYHCCVYICITMISILNATRDDIPTIRQLAEKIWWPTYSSIIPQGQIEYMLATIYSESTIREKMNNGSEIFLLLKDHGKEKAFASYGTSQQSGNVWKINKLYVLPECHGKGFGKALIDEIYARAIKNDINTLILNVNRSNPAFAFYQKYGFKTLREEDIPIGPYWMNDYVLSLPVSPHPETK